MRNFVASLGSLIEPAKLRRAGSDDFPILSMTMRHGLVDQGDKFKKRIASRDTSTYKIVRRGQLVVGFPIDEGVLSFQDKYDEAIVSPAYEIWDVCDPTRIDRAYLERFLRSPRALAYYAGKLQGTTARRRSLPKDVFLELPVVMSDLAQQRGIAQVLGHVDSLRAKRREAVALLDDLAESIFLDMFGDPSRNRMNWPMKKIGDLASSANYGTSEKASDSGDLPVLRMNNITASGQVDLSNLKFMNRDTTSEKYLARYGDVLFNRTNSPELVGKSAIYRGSADLAFAGYLVRVRVNEFNDPEYLAAFLNTRYAKRVLRGMCKSIVGMANINARELQGIDIAEPPLHLQVQFGERIRAVEAMRGAHRQHLDKLDALFTSIQSRAFRGELWPDSAAPTV
ncbi:restriction endonuclease subunit S [Streptomyces sp. NPDC049967]|uniref:restriction endonuclease subunit S n=1 Tax=Streptomyces sp. NPDC049967 TaxID=3155658 RepID=UPI00341B8D11